MYIFYLHVHRGLDVFRLSVKAERQQDAPLPSHRDEGQFCSQNSVEEHEVKLWRGGQAVSTTSPSITTLSLNVQQAPPISAIHQQTPQHDSSTHSLHNSLHGPTTTTTPMPNQSQPTTTPTAHRPPHHRNLPLPADEKCPHR